MFNEVSLQSRPTIAFTGRLKPPMIRAISNLERRVITMPKMIAYCGLVCTNCPTYLATQANDDVARGKTVELYSKKFGLKLKPEDINCDGCLSVGGKLIGYCQSCEIRRCCINKKVENCTACGEQPCEQLKQFHKFSPDAKTNYDALINEMNQS
jgi:hypothetical protein